MKKEVFGSISNYKDITTIEKKQIEVYEKPSVLTPKNVIFYSHHSQALMILDENGVMKKTTVIAKAQKFLINNSIRWDIDLGCFFCNPIKGYNTSRYKIEKRVKGFECDCQACNRKILNKEYNPDTEDTAPCSHILALYLWFKLGGKDEKSM